MTTGQRVQYVYAIARAELDLSGAPSGVGGAPVDKVVEGEIAALTSALDASEYSAGLIEQRAGEVEWLAPRAEAHNAVVSWGGDPGPIAPLHMWTMFRDEGAIRAMLRERQSELTGVLRRLVDADEYGLRVYVDPVALEQGGADLGADVADLEKSRDFAGPGQRYLIERKLERTRREAARALAVEVADSVFDALRAKSVAAARDEIPSAGAADGSAVLSAAFLVQRGKLDEFRAAVTLVVRAREPHGFRFAFTGPWPPYHFASEG